MSFPPATEMFQFAGFASAPYGFRYGYPKGPGFPIRKSTDQSLLTAPRGLSQRATSFIASQCQGIHQMPLRRLISALTSTGTAHASGRTSPPASRQTKTRSNHCRSKAQPDQVRDQASGIRRSPTPTRHPKNRSKAKASVKQSILFTMSNTHADRHQWHLPQSRCLTRVLFNFGSKTRSRTLAAGS